MIRQSTPFGVLWRLIAAFMPAAFAEMPVNSGSKMPPGA
jgi:hypothetical protein